ncbi:DUF4235 domain-containing protein [Flaviflexus equikiangi]|uniref:DUF4235 domain-containing protein n=1 Tax=Flaviflexus equikiangi TaxID=2758573 RepID=A0ABS2THA7_9ACTO|nr:DUF4235 domain-containing protein [Flaviflexus equikiangi]MBM9434026.1 DUF4235 domain-containing protein [Flaviflexus equikiangi]
MDIGWKIISTGGGLVAGLAAKKIVEYGWQFATGHNAPDEDDFESNLVEAVVFSVVAAATNTIIRNLVMKKASDVYGRAAKSVER